MIITQLDTMCLSRLHEPDRQWITSRYRTVKADCAIVIIRTDEGLQGIGEASAYGWPLMIQEWVRWLAPQFVGRDPLDPQIAPHPNGRSWSYDAAVAGIDSALWDLRGKAADCRVCDLLAERPRDRVRLYASGGCRYDWRYNPQQLVEEASDYVKQGYTAFKFRIGTDWEWDGVTADRFLGLVQELAQAVAGRMELMLDGNCRLTEQQALAIARELDRLGFAWFEEPIPSDQIEGYARLAAAVDTPITGGESLATLEQFRPYLERRAYDIVQPDVGLCGISEARRIADMARQNGADLCPHNWHNGLLTMAHAHLMAALPSRLPLELCMHQGPLQWAVLAHEPAIDVGWLSLPDKPGLGVDLGQDLEARFPYIEGHYAIQVMR